MLKIDRDQKSFTRLNPSTLTTLSIGERSDLQEFICNCPQAFFDEIGQDLFLVDKEVPPSQAVQDRIDLLAIDREGNSVVIELKRGNHKLQLLQAISYAAMISSWSPRDFAQRLGPSRYEELVEEFLQVDPEEINRRQRIILVAEGFDYAILATAEWLAEQHGIDILCCQMSLAKDTASGVEYLACSNAFPPPKLAQLAVSRRDGKTASAIPWSDWDSALASVSNQAVVEFFKTELPNQEHYLRKRLLTYRLGGTRRWFVAVRDQHAYVWQYARFEQDIKFWRRGLSEPAKVGPVKDGQCLRFFLTAPSDFKYFKGAVTTELANVAWTSRSADGGEEGLEGEDT